MHVAGISKTSLRTLPGVKQLLHIKSVHGKEIGHFNGIFKTSEEALLSAPVTTRSTWDDESLVHTGIGIFSSIHDFDLPVIDQLKHHLDARNLSVVTDFGGHIGVKYTAYSRAIKFPQNFQWQVVEVPAVIEEARRRIGAEVTALQFFERLEDTAPCQVLLCSGSLQYVAPSIEQLIESLPQKPLSVILNKVPVSKKKPFFTVERFIKHLAYRVYGPNELEECRTRLGYKLQAKWAIPDRDILVLHPRGIERVHSVGEIWTCS